MGRFVARVTPLIFVFPTFVCAPRAIGGPWGDDLTRQCGTLFRHIKPDLTSLRTFGVFVGLTGRSTDGPARCAIYSGLDCGSDGGRVEPNLHDAARSTNGCLAQLGSLIDRPR